MGICSSTFCSSKPNDGTSNYDGPADALFGLWGFKHRTGLENEYPHQMVEEYEKNGGDDKVNATVKPLRKRRARARAHTNTHTKG